MTHVAFTLGRWLVVGLIMQRRTGKLSHHDMAYFAASALIAGAFLTLEAMIR